jgi:prophage antirepressor-like protein
MSDLIESIDLNMKFNKYNVRIIGTHDNPLFVVKDICKVLGLSNTTEVLRNIPVKWKGSEKLNTSTQGEQNTNVVTEPGLYKIIMRSNKKIAQPFQEFVCEEVLPTIRKTGQYKMSEEYQKTLQEKIKELENNKKELENANNRITELELESCNSSVYHCYKKSNNVLLYVGKSNTVNNKINSHESQANNLRISNFILFDRMLSTMQTEEYEFKVIKNNLSEKESANIEKEHIQKLNPLYNTAHTKNKYKCTIDKCTRTYDYLGHLIKHQEKYHTRKIDINANMKECTICKQNLSFDFFYESREWLDNRCKNCVNQIRKDKKEEKINNPEIKENIFIKQYNMKGIYINTFETVAIAEEKTGIPATNIYQNLNGHTLSGHNFIWKYSNDKNNNENIEEYKSTCKRDGIPVLKYNLLGNFIQKFDNMKLAGDGNGKRISECCSGKKKTYNNFIYKLMENNEIPLKIEPYKRKVKSRNVFAYKNEIKVHSFESLKETGIFFEKSPPYISGKIKDGKEVNGFILKDY